MTQTPGDQQAGGRRPNSTDSFLDGLRRIDLRRSDDGWLGGVCAGLASRLGLDPLVIRALFAVLSLALGLGAVAYLAAWLLIPDTDEDVHLEQALRNGEAGSVVLLVATVLSVFGTFGWFGGGWFTDNPWGGNIFWGLLSLLLLVGGVAWLWSEWRSRPDPGFYARHVSASAPPPPGASGTPGGEGPDWGARAQESASGQSTEHPTATAGLPAIRPAHPPATTELTAGTTGPSWSHGTGATAWSPGPEHAPEPARPARPPKPPKPPKRLGRRSAGVAGTLLGTGLALAVGGGLHWAVGEYDWPGNPLLVGLAGALGVLGLTVLTLGLAGRTSGFPGFLAVVALIGTAFFLPIADHFVPSGKMGEYTWSPRTAAELEEDAPFRVGAGTGTLQLHGLSPDELDGETVTASVGFGQLVIDVPDDLTVRIDAGTAGGVVRNYEDDASYIGGLNVSEDILIGDGPVDLTIDARVGFGQILLKGGDR